MTAAPALSRLAQAALEYAKRGWFVFPLKPGGKTPATPRGFQDATTALEQVEAWWRQSPNANIGLWPGPSKLCVIDLDGPAGEATAAALGLLTEPTLQVRTGRAEGGRHLYFHGPGFPVSNADLGDGIDVRCHGGYVVLPPSVHPSGAVYKWEGRFSEVRQLPPAIITRLRGTSGVASAPASDPVVVGSAIGEGGRNNTLTRIAGRLLCKHPIAEAIELLWGVNLANCRPPLERNEVEAIVASIAQKEARKRVTGTGAILALAQPEEDTSPDPTALAIDQAERAVERQRRDLSGAPAWFSKDLTDLCGKMLPGDLWVTGALMGNGKTTFMLSQMQYLADHGMATLYLPLEVDVEDVRRRWAAWSLGLDWKLVARNEIAPEGRAALEEMIATQSRIRHVQFPEDRRVSLDRLEELTRWGVDKIGATCIVVDHLHRMEFGGVGANYRVLVTEAVRRLKDLARKYKVTILATAQLNQDGAQLDRYFPPTIRRLKESAGIGEEADVVLMLSRCLKHAIDGETMRLIQSGMASERDYEATNKMRVTCRKHRLDDSARDRSVALMVDNGKLRDCWYGEAG